MKIGGDLGALERAGFLKLGGVRGEEGGRGWADALAVELISVVGVNGASVGEVADAIRKFPEYVTHLDLETATRDMIAAAEGPEGAESDALADSAAERQMRAIYELVAIREARK